MVVSKRKSLAGINGIPLEQDQYADSVVFGISSRASIARGTVGKALLPGGRVWNVGNILRKREYGGELFGNFVVHYSLKVGGSEKDVWWEDGRWFSREGA